MIFRESDSVTSAELKNTQNFRFEIKQLTQIIQWKNLMLQSTHKQLLCVQFMNK